MQLQKRTYALPPEMLEEFERNVASGKRSAVVAQLLRDWLETRRREELRHAVIEGCREMAEIYGEITAEYHPLEEEAARAQDG